MYFLLIRCIKDTIGQNEAMCNCLVVVRTLMAVIQKCLQLYRCLTDETADISVLIEAVLHSMWTILADGKTDFFFYVARGQDGVGIHLNKF